MSRKLTVLLSLFIMIAFLVPASLTLAATSTKKEVTSKTSAAKKSTTKKMSTTTKKSTKKAKATTKKSTKKALATKKSGTKKTTASAKSKTSKPFKGKINVNTASKNELMQLPGIGPVKADAIIKARKKQGKFKNSGDLMNVKGIGEKTVKNMNKNLKF